MEASSCVSVRPAALRTGPGGTWLTASAKANCTSTEFMSSNATGLLCLAACTAPNLKVDISVANEQSCVSACPNGTY
jgi:hypothetical protein